MKIGWLPAALSLGAALLVGGCSQAPSASTQVAALATISAEPLATESWQFGQIGGVQIHTPHYRVFTTVRDPLYQRLIARVLESAYARFKMLNPHTDVPGPLDCYVFGDRSQWELFTKMRAGQNSSIYLQISAGGYCQNGVFAGYDIGREQTLAVIAHEAWHQYSWFALRDRLPSWLEEGIATQSENIEWDGTQPLFVPARNYRRFLALKYAVRENRLWKLSDLMTTHAGRAIRRGQKSVDAYYAQVWSLALFLENNPRYRTGLVRMLGDARDGRLSLAMIGTGVSRAEVVAYTERWNYYAGPVYMKKYINADLAQFEEEYIQFVQQLTDHWPPKI